MNSQEKDQFATIVDAFFNDDVGCIDGIISGFTFSVPMEYEEYNHLLPVDTEIQEKLEYTLQEIAVTLGINRNSLGSLSPPASSIQRHPFGDVVAMKTTADGDCLLHALSLCMWGREDHYRLLRGLMSLAFANEKLSELMEDLFVEEEKKRDIELGFPGAREDKQLREDYANAANAAHTVGTYLEGIHICCMSHILRRPIVVLDGDDATRLRNRSESAISNPRGQSLAGVYLPILHSSSSCSTKSPLVVVYTSDFSSDESKNSSSNSQISNIECNHVGHFTALVGCDCIREKTSPNEIIRLVPLVMTSTSMNEEKATLLSLPIRYGLLSDNWVDERKGQKRRSQDDTDRLKRILRKYLDVESVPSGNVCPYVAKQFIDDRDKDTHSISRFVTNNYLSSTAYNRRSSYLQKIIHDKEEEKRHLQNRINQLTSEIRSTSADLDDSNMLFTKTNTNERYYLRKWQKYGDSDDGNGLSLDRFVSNAKVANSRADGRTGDRSRLEYPYKESREYTKTKHPSSHSTYEQREVPREIVLGAPSVHSPEGRSRYLPGGSRSTMHNIHDYEAEEERNIQEAMAASLKDLEEKKEETVSTKTTPEKGFLKSEFTSPSDYTSPSEVAPSLHSRDIPSQERYATPPYSFDRGVRSNSFRSEGRNIPIQTSRVENRTSQRVSNRRLNRHIDI